ncbi:MAG: hypothetical protein GX110_05320 [Synergistaceae bacterium]|jgi:multidrug resistance efflux pump|nr:hypothetical protein [Synergistaceae bacterium]
MKVRFSSPKKQNPDEDGGLPVRYGPGKRAVPKWKWYALVLVISTPLLFLLWRVGAALFFINAPGVVSLEKVSINSPFPAVVERIYASPGAKAAQGELLMRLEDPAVTQRIYVLKAELEALKAGTPAPSGSAPAGAAMAKVRIAEENVRYQKGYRDSIQSLFNQGAATRAEVDAAEDRYRQALAGLAEAKTSLLLLQSPDFSRQESIARNNSRIAQIEAEMKVLEERKGFFSVVSPHEGRILDVFTSEGQSVGGGAPLVLLGRPQSLTIMAYLQPRHISYTGEGEKVTVRFPGSISVAGRVSAAPEIAARIPAELAGVLGEGKQTLLVRVSLDEELAGHLRVEGLPVSVHLGFSLLKSLQMLSGDS